MHGGYLNEPSELAKTSLYRRTLRRWSSEPCKGWLGYHDAVVVIDRSATRRSLSPVDQGDPRWPTRCDSCEYTFGPEDDARVWLECLYLMEDGTLTTLGEAPPGSWWVSKSVECQQGEAHMITALPITHPSRIVRLGSVPSRSLMGGTRTLVM